ncbi:hypothetical protein DV515_00007878, partial [Chloebia gouldiae]
APTAPFCGGGRRGRSTRGGGGGAGAPRPRVRGRAGRALRGRCRHAPRGRGGGSRRPRQSGRGPGNLSRRRRLCLPRAAPAPGGGARALSPGEPAARSGGSSAGRREEAQLPRSLWAWHLEGFLVRRSRDLQLSALIVKALISARWLRRWPPPPSLGSERAPGGLRAGSEAPRWQRGPVCKQWTGTLLAWPRLNVWLGFVSVPCKKRFESMI